MELLKIAEAYTKGMAAVQCALDGLKAARDKLPEGEDKETVVKKIEEVEHAILHAKAEMGESMGYVLCQCTWPAQVMVLVGSSEEGKRDLLKCPNCGKQLSRPHKTEAGTGGWKFDPYDVY